MPDNELVARLRVYRLRRRVRFVTTAAFCGTPRDERPDRARPVRAKARLREGAGEEVVEADTRGEARR